MNGAHIMARIRLFLLAVMCWLCLVPAAHAIRPQTPAELQLKEETPGQQPLVYWSDAMWDVELRNGLFVLNNPLRYTDPTGHGPNDYTGASGRAMLQDEDPEATRVVQSARQSAGTMATVGRTVAEMNPIVGAVNGAIGAKTGNDAITGEKLTTGARVLAGVGAVASLIPGEGAEAKAGAGLLKNAERGRAAEAKVLGELGLVKNTEKVIGKEGKSIPDFKTANVIGEIKDTKRVTDSPQLRIQKEAAQQSGMAHELHTGVNTAVSEKAASGTTVIRRPDLGPASSQ